jgi:hypothetical protein
MGQGVLQRSNLVKWRQMAQLSRFPIHTAPNISVGYSDVWQLSNEWSHPLIDGMLQLSKEDVFESNLSNAKMRTSTLLRAEEFCEVAFNE